MAESPPGANQSGRAGVFVSIIVPLYNSADLIEDCHKSLSSMLEEHRLTAEVVFVDDGSRDDTLDLLRIVQARDARVRVVELAGNSGQQAAMLAGIEHARGQHLLTFDVDLQYDPQDIPKVLAPLSQGYDFVSGYRLERRDPMQRRFVSRCLTMLASHIGGIALRDVGCSLNAITDELAVCLNQCGESRRFPKPVAARLAHRIMEVEVRHRPRARRMPRSSYSRTALVHLFMDFLMAVVPGLFAWIFVLSASLLAGLMAAATLLAGLWAVGLVGAVWPLVVAALAAFLFLVALGGLAGEWMRRIYRQTAGSPLYIVRRVHEPAPEVPG